ncbi:ThiF family adenylyltransferase [Promethearchaeum syntrophicum]|uniref:ThiF family adenylyltransferase n=1 Tax=Promethearchaeum syntrophicum TaxID=2594042 RepID=A0A5B9D7S6_9ARCH|nr:HesA/MoeB/ThiF family protein [Candidatus Prometheoarchaeum syntrophicum]QEE15081.1 putative adenylyltransferase [Candidatus Prometheoarchaeum syntrophicum]
MLTSEELERYQRQILIIGKNGQELLKQKKVLQVGLGGLGSPLSLYLVSSGIGELIVFENDALSLSNLGRQILYNTEDVNMSKGGLAKSVLSKLNPNIKITIINERFTMQSAEKCLKNAKIDYLVDASDNFETKFLINDIGLKYNIPFTIAGIQGFDGQLISVNPHETACYRCIFGDMPKNDKLKPIPVMSPTCGVVGSLEANEVIKGLLKRGKRITDNLLMISLDLGDFTLIPIKKNPNCECQLKN